MIDLELLTVTGLLERSLRESISLESVAAQVGCPARDLQRRFVEATGEGLMDYVRGRRLTVAMGEVLQGDRSLSDIARGLRFTSLEHLVQAFQARFALPPRRFQRGRLSAHPAGKAPLTPDYLALLASRALSLRPDIVEGKARRLIGLARVLPIGAQSTAEGFAAIDDVIRRFRATLDPLANAAELLAAPLVLASCRVPEARREDGDGILIQPSLDAARFRQVPPEFTELQVPACRFAVFTYSGPADGLKQVEPYIMGTWFPRSDWWFGTTPALSELARLPDGSVRARLFMPVRRRNPRLRAEAMHPE